MLSGFNTQIEFAGTVFHIQTEVRKEGGIETSVYVKGAVVHSFKTSHPAWPRADGDEQRFRHLLEGQHRNVIQQIRAGEIKPPALPATKPDPSGNL